MFPDDTIHGCPLPARAWGDGRDSLYWLLARRACVARLNPFSTRYLPMTSPSANDDSMNDTQGTQPAGVKQASGTAEQFETAYQQLQRVVGQLEQGQLTLAESLRAYEQGVGWLRTCYQGLQEVEQQIRILTKVDADGQVEWQNFDATATASASDSGAGQAPASRGNTAANMGANTAASPAAKSVRRRKESTAVEAAEDSDPGLLF